MLYPIELRVLYSGILRFLLNQTWAVYAVFVSMSTQNEQQWEQTSLAARRRSKSYPLRTERASIMQDISSVANCFVTISKLL